jgi:hypothetical protein
MAKGNHWSNYDTPLETQSLKGSAEGQIDYGGVAEITEANDPLGVLPKDAKPRNIGPSSKD